MHFLDLEPGKLCYYIGMAPFFFFGAFSLIFFSPKKTQNLTHSINFLQILTWYFLIQTLYVVFRFKFSLWNYLHNSAYIINVADKHLHQKIIYIPYQTNSWYITQTSYPFQTNLLFSITDYQQFFLRASISCSYFSNFPKFQCVAKIALPKKIYRYLLKTWQSLSLPMVLGLHLLK